MVRKVFISADIEGIATTTIWPQCNRGEWGYEEARVQMTKEVAAACDGARAAGAQEIVVKDSHDSGVNIIPSGLPEYVELIRNWSGSPYSMVTGIGPDFDAVLFVGYHSAAGRDGNPLSHTMDTEPTAVRINGRKASEFMIYSWACALEGVPTVFVSGDRMLCEDYADLHPLCKSVAVKEGFGGLTKSIHPDLACRRIREGAEQALRQDLTNALCTLPNSFKLEISYAHHPVATRKSFFPGCRKTDDNTVELVTDRYQDVLTAISFLI